MCRGENPAYMKFCRSCGSSLSAPPAPQPTIVPSAMPPMGGMPPAGPFNTPPPPAPRPSGPAIAATAACPRCGTQTPVGYQFCQQCGLHMGALQPTDPGAGARNRPPSVAPPMGNLPAMGGLPPGIDPQGATLAADPRKFTPSSPSPVVVPGVSGVAVARTASSSTPPPPPQPSLGSTMWGQAVLVNRDGSDGQRYPLAGDSLVFGRAGADVAFEDDRFLARQHARLERAPDGSIKLTALDTLNGVFRKADAPVDLVDGSIVLVGREVLRFELVEPEEKAVHPLVRHGVALFGSPPREPWGRLLQIIPSGGYRDVRHLIAEEVVLGREEGEIVYRDDAFMSRRHAAITWNGQRAQITDLGSSNGTFLKVTTLALKHGDHVRMGDQLLRIELGR